MPLTAESAPMMATKASAIAAMVNGEGIAVGLDPASIIALIMSIIQQFMAGCKLTPAQAVARGQSPRPLDPIRIQILAFRHGLAAHAETLVPAVMHVGVTTSTTDYESMYAEAAKAA